MLQKPTFLEARFASMRSETLVNSELWDLVSISAANLAIAPEHMIRFRLEAKVVSLPLKFHEEDCMLWSLNDRSSGSSSNVNDELIAPAGFNHTKSKGPTWRRVSLTCFDFLPLYRLRAELLRMAKQNIVKAKYHLLYKYLGSSSCRREIRHLLFVIFVAAFIQHSGAVGQIVLLEERTLLRRRRRHYFLLFKKVGFGKAMFY
jgi:hypothetical protein